MINHSMNQSAGIFFYSQSTKRFLYLLRNDDKSNTWGIPGGKIETGETLIQGLQRECIEELNYFPTDAKLVPIQKFINNNFTYHTFFCAINDEFIPLLNDEHIGYSWVGHNQYPKPLHPGLFNTINFDVVQEKLRKLLSKIEK